MKTLDIVKGSIILIIFCVGFYLLINYVFSELEKKEKCFRIEFNSGAIYWSDNINVISENQISFFDVHRKRNVKIYGQFTISMPKNSD